MTIRIEPSEAEHVNENQSGVPGSFDATISPAPGPSNLTSAPAPGPSKLTSAPAPGPSKSTSAPAPGPPKVTSALAHVPGPTIETMIWADRKETNQQLNGIEEISQEFECDTDLVKTLWEKDFLSFKTLVRALDTSCL